MQLAQATDVTTAPIAALGLVGGYVVARESGIRPLGGVVLGAAGLYAGRTWLAKAGGAGAAGLAAVSSAASVPRTHWRRRSGPGRRCSRSPPSAQPPRGPSPIAGLSPPRDDAGRAGARAGVMTIGSLGPVG